MRSGDGRPDLRRFQRLLIAAWPARDEFFTRASAHDRRFRRLFRRLLIVGWPACDEFFARGRLARIARSGITIIRDDLFGPIIGRHEGWERRQYSPSFEHGAIGKCARDPQPCQTQHNYHHDEPPARAREAIVKAIGAVRFVSLDRPHLASVAVIGHRGQERRCSRARQNPLPIISAKRKLMPCVYVSKLVNRCPMFAGFPREASEFGGGSGKMSVGWCLLLFAVLSRYRGWLPAPKGTLILAPLTLLGRGVVLL